MKAALIMSASRSLQEALHEVLSPDFAVTAADRSFSCTLPSGQHEFLFIFADVEALLDVGGRDGIRGGIEHLRDQFPTTAVIVVGALDQLRPMVGAIQAGAVNYLTTPIEAAEVSLIVRMATKQRSRQLDLSFMHRKPGEAPEFETRNERMRRVYEQVKMVAPTNSTVLLTGETGVGKGVVARMLHKHSTRSAEPFIGIHCGSIPDTLVESELFGHEKGSFTGALRQKLGKFEIADGGTIFLDEIGTISAAAQVKLLRVLQERRIQRVGGEDDIPVNVRVIAAANQDLALMCKDGTFRSDLFYRLNVFPVHLPPLRNRLEDLPLLVDVFLTRMNEELQRKIKAASPEVMQAFSQYNWPGNIRELENVIERGCILENHDELRRENIPDEILGAAIRAPLSASDLRGSLSEVRQRAVELVECEYLKILLTTHRGRINESASAAGIGARQLHKLLLKHGIRKADFKAPARRRS